MTPVIRVGRRIHVITHKLDAMLGIPRHQTLRSEATDEDVTGDVPALGRTVR